MVGVACLGGLWTGGRVGGNGPDAVASSGDTSLWDFTENGIVGLGSHSPPSNGSARVRWDVTFAGQFVWAAMGASITPLGAAMLDDGGVDGGPDDASVDAGSDDAAPDQRPPDDLGPPDVLADGMGAIDQSADGESPDAAVDRGPPGGDAGVDGAGDAERPDAVSVPDGGAEVSPAADAGSSIHDTHLDVGCACQTGVPGRAGPLPTLALVAAALWRRRARRR
jgi:MYXO-CTERM domain-containing protein